MNLLFTKDNLLDNVNYAILNYTDESTIANPLNHNRLIYSAKKLAAFRLVLSCMSNFKNNIILAGGAAYGPIVSNTSPDDWDLYVNSEEDVVQFIKEYVHYRVDIGRDPFATFFGKYSETILHDSPTSGNIKIQVVSMGGGLTGVRSVLETFDLVHSMCAIDKQGIYWHHPYAFSRRLTVANMSSDDNLGMLGKRMSKYSQRYDLEINEDTINDLLKFENIFPNRNAVIEFLAIKTNGCVINDQALKIEISNKTIDMLVADENITIPKYDFRGRAEGPAFADRLVTAGRGLTLTGNGSAY